MKLITAPCCVRWRVVYSGTAVLLFKERYTARSELLTAITNCHCARAGERHKLVCVYSLTDPLIPATPPAPLLCPNLSGGFTGPGWQMGRRGQPSVGCVERLRPGVSLSPPQLRLGSSLTWPVLTPRLKTRHTSCHKPRYKMCRNHTYMRRIDLSHRHLELLHTHTHNLSHLSAPPTIQGRFGDVISMLVSPDKTQPCSSILVYTQSNLIRAWTKWRRCNEWAVWLYPELWHWQRRRM